MMAEDRQNEPSMEEILASIRRIISENEEVYEANEEPAENQKVNDAEPGRASSDNSETETNDEDVLLLSCELQDDGTVIDLNTGDIKGETGIESVLAGDILKASNNASATSFSRIASIANDHGRERGTVLEEQTIEHIVKEVMRPMIRQWLDDNLPTVVERMVEKEIKSIMREADEMSRG